MATKNGFDIEDVGDSNELIKNDNHIKTRKKFKNGTENDIENDCIDYIPETQNIYIKTWGCSHNISDSEYMSGLLAEYGYNIITDDNKCDLANLWILNSCTVKGPSEAHFLTLIRKAKSKNKYIIAAGCVPQGDKKINELNNISIIGVQQIDRILEVVQQTLAGNAVRLFGAKRIKDETGKRKLRMIDLILTHFV